MAKKAGFQSYLYRNSASYASPTWDLVPIVQDLDLPDSMTEIEVSDRASAIKKFIPGMQDLSLSFEADYDYADTDVAALETAYLARTGIEMAIANGACNAGTWVVGTRYLRGKWVITSFAKTEPLDDSIKVSITMRPTPSSDADFAYVVVSA